MRFTYVNKQSYPITLPTETRGKVTFRPGEGSPKYWFSRFCSPKMLSAVPIGEKVNAPTPVKTQVKRLKTQVKRPSISRVPDIQPSFPDETTNDYTLQRGIYTCKRCEIFKTGSKASLLAHIKFYHKEEPVEDETPLVSSKASATKVKKEDDEPTPLVSTKPIADTGKVVEPVVEDVVKDDGLFHCSVSGCDKVFKSERGLKLHITKAHGDSNE